MSAGHTNNEDALAGTTVLVVGGAKNIGREIARRSADAGAKVVVGARSMESANDAAAQIDNARGIAIDVTDEASIAAAAAELRSVDHVVVTAAAHHNVPVAELEHDKVVTAFEAKVIGPLLLAKHFAPIMPATGSFLLFSGVAAWKPSAGLSIMGITNGAVSFAASNLAVELAPIRVNAISPGIIDSGTWDSMPADDRKAFFDGVAEGNPVRRTGTLDDIADAALWLLSAGFVSGETVHVEGGARQV
ncbi:SDR family oxidoreductase [Williamsia sterculiae]|uniref:NAD(P)-dependent dehydrogenase, short-chain alcohol dehydrogenase family n=1 Tax=Williamsia sterculiae TaxID=1344003 RepID=A0A1N7CN37_9NOCA|nr:SDR family oxidoreductase [Williamsia sterculiae]SIR65002.1 NAD(P)-dependent dehydrogenase, short-chain alcohol dehydrogenase family [Williamsia sterculiae]